MGALKAAPLDNRGRVLVIDDMPDVRGMVRTVLVRSGFVVTEASSGREGVERCMQEAFDLVVSDVHMPDMDGVGLLCALHERDPELPVILMSGAPDLETAMKAVEYGASEYLTKPLELVKLETSAHRLVDARRGRQESQRQLEAYRSGERSKSPSVRGRPRESWTGELLGGRYRIGKLLGEGGMGAVYEAVREDLAHMRVAVKVLHPELGDRPELVARFRREAETVAQIDHPNIVKMLDFQDDSDDPAFLVMERLEGSSLAQSIDTQGALAPSRVAFIAQQMLAALSAAHERGVIHRDLKPDNVFLTSVSGLRDIVKVLDFGIAKLALRNGEPKLTETGMVLGTPPYMAPEHARGAEIDLRADVYAVGCVMYEALAGRPPFAAQNYNALLCSILESEPQPLLELNPRLDPVLAVIAHKAMAKHPADRFQSADSMSRALAHWRERDSARPASVESSTALAPTLLVPSVAPRLPGLERDPERSRS